MFTNGGVFVGKDLTISQILVVGGGTYVEKILSVGRVFHPKEAVKCSSIVIQKAKSTSISQIVGHPWLILILDNHIMIGCVLYTKRKWSTITADHIGKISPHGLEWWQKNKELIRFLEAGGRMSTEYYYRYNWCSHCGSYDEIPLLNRVPAGTPCGIHIHIRPTSAR
jgi:hypothetical protein